MLDVVSRLCDVENIELSVKFGYDMEALKLDVTTLFPRVKFIPSATKFASIMGRFDIFIFPWLSTPFFEAICGRTAILLYCDSRYEVLTEEAEYFIKQGATLAKTKSDFLANIDQIKKTLVSRFLKIFKF